MRPDALGTAWFFGASRLTHKEDVVGTFGDAFGETEELSRHTARVDGGTNGASALLPGATSRGRVRQMAV